MTGDRLSSEARVVREASLLSAEIGTEIVVLDPEEGAYYDTDAVGADVWRLVAQPIRIADLCKALQEMYEVDPATCEADVLAFLEAARSDNLIRVLD